MVSKKITSATVRDDFNDPRAVVHYARAAHKLGLWQSEQIILTRHIPQKTSKILEAGCGAGRVSIALHELGHTRITAFDFAAELVDQARHLADERRIAIPFHQADATKLQNTPPAADAPYDVVLFMFNGLMQIPLRRNRRRALRQLHNLARQGAVLIFTTHDRDSSPAERALWRLEALRWINNTRDPRLREFGDRYFEDDIGRTFMHLPDRSEILADLRATGWTHTADHMRNEISKETRAVHDFSDNCRFWIARKN